MTLIERLEQAEAGSEHLDCLIENALGLAKFDRDPKVGFGDADYNRREPKPYTTSIDAAMSLTDGFFHLTRFPKGDGEAAVEYRDRDGPYFVQAATPALALCIASLKAAGYE